MPSDRLNPNTVVTTSPADRDVERFVQLVARRVAKRFKISIKSCTVFPLENEEITEAMGLCEYKDGIIYVNLYRSYTKSYYLIETLIDTVIHELAHAKLKTGLHNKAFDSVRKEMLDWYYTQDRKK